MSRPPGGEDSTTRFLMPYGSGWPVPAKFLQRVDKLLAARNSLLCVGIDPDPEQMPRSLRRIPPATQLTRFVSGILSATRPFCSAYKVQLGSYLGYGLPRPQDARRASQADRLDALFGSSTSKPTISRTSCACSATASSVGWAMMRSRSPHGWGWETLAPFFEDASKGIFVVAHTSNPGAPDFQEIPTPRGPLWLAIVAEVRRLAHAHGNLGVVVGAPYSDAIRAARGALGNSIPILVPGVGSRGGALATAVRDGVDGHGRQASISASRSIIYASTGPDWKRAAGVEARRMMIQINQLR